MQVGTTVVVRVMLARCWEEVEHEHRLALVDVSLLLCRCTAEGRAALWPASTAVRAVLPGAIAGKCGCVVLEQRTAFCFVTLLPNMALVRLRDKNLVCPQALP